MRKSLIISLIVSVTYATDYDVKDVHQLPKDYNSLSHEEKIKVLHEKALATQYKEYPSDPSGLSSILAKIPAGIGLFSMSRRNRVFEKGDVYEANDIARITHYPGSTMVTKYKPNEKAKKYSGFFSEEASNIMRFSSAVGVKVQPKTPSIALKFPFKGEDEHYGSSANVVLINEVNGFGPHIELDEDTSFFTKTRDFSSKLGKPIRDGVKNILYPKFNESAESTTTTKATGFHLGTYAMAKYNKNGDVQKVVSPYKISLRPSGVLLEDKFQKGSHNKEDYREQLNSIKKGDLLFDVIAYEKEDSPGEVIASIIAESKNVVSKFGDEGLRYQHDFIPSSAENKEHAKLVTCPFTGRSATLEKGMIGKLYDFLTGNNS